MELAAALGLVVGAVLGLLGAGGSIIAIPALVYGVGMPLSAAVPTSLLVVTVSAAGGLVVRWRSRVIRWPVALVFAVASVPTAVAGASLGRQIPDRWAMLAFGILMAVVAVRMFAPAPTSGGACRTTDGTVNWRSCLPRSLAAGAVVGLLTGVFGVGGGFVIVPVLTLLLGLDALEAVATSLVVITVTALAGLIAHASAGTDIDHHVAAVFGGAALIGAVIAARYGSRLPTTTVRLTFALLVFVVAGAVTISALFFPATLHSG